MIFCKKSEKARAIEKTSTRKIVLKIDIHIDHLELRNSYVKLKYGTVAKIAIKSNFLKFELFFFRIFSDFLKILKNLKKI